MFVEHFVFSRCNAEHKKQLNTSTFLHTFNTKYLFFLKKKEISIRKIREFKIEVFFLWGKVEEREREEEAECRKFSIELLYHCDDYCYYYCYYLLNMLNFRRQNKTVHVKKKITEKHASKKEEKKKHICIST